MVAADPLATYTMADLAGLLQRSERYVADDLVAERRIGYLQLGPRTIRFTRPQIEAFYADVTVPLAAARLTVVTDIASWRAA